MIITRSPLRISLGGGGTDLPSYYQEHTGFLIAAAIDKYVYITLHQTFVPELIIKYSKLERVASSRPDRAPDHPRGHAAGRRGDASALELSSMADIPAGTGLGESSGSFTTALLQALHAHKNNLVHPAELAEQACHIELEKLQVNPSASRTNTSRPTAASPVSSFLPDGSVEGVAAQDQRGNPLQPRRQPAYSFSRATRARPPKSSRNRTTRARRRQGHGRQPPLRQRPRPPEPARARSGDLDEFGRLMDIHWQRKKERSGGMSNPQINEWYDLGHGQRRAGRQAHRRGRRRLS